MQLIQGGTQILFLVKDVRVHIPCDYHYFAGTTQGYNGLETVYRPYTLSVTVLQKPSICPIVFFSDL